MVVEMRAPCPRCQSGAGRIETRNGQDCVFCADCGGWCYNAPKTETGREQRSLRTRPNTSSPPNVPASSTATKAVVLCATGMTQP